MGKQLVTGQVTIIDRGLPPVRSYAHSSTASSYQVAGPSSKTMGSGHRGQACMALLFPRTGLLTAASGSSCVLQLAEIRHCLVMFDAHCHFCGYPHATGEETETQTEKPLAIS